MALTSKQIFYIEGVIKTSLRDEFLNYKPESNNMPFHYRLLGKDRMALYSFIQSLNTTDFKKQVDSGLKELDDGNWRPHEAVEKRMLGWFKGYGNKY